MPSPWNKLVMICAATIFVANLAGCSSAPLRIVTSSQPEPSGMEALLAARLESGDDGCVYARRGDELATLVWPKGYSVSGDSDSFTVQDAKGVAVAQSGIDLNIGGGGVDAVDDRWSNKGCATGVLWMVGQIAPSAAAQ